MKNLLKLLGVLVLSTATLTQQQDYVQLVDPQHYWLDGGNVPNWNYQNAAVRQVQDRPSNRPFYYQLQPRLFGGMLFSSSFPNLFANLQRTSYSFVATTPTSIITAFCTEKAAFAATNACPIRRRRGIVMDDEIQSLAPSAVLPEITTSLVASSADAQQQTKRDIAILSSKDEILTDQLFSDFNRAGKLLFNGSGPVVVVTTVATPIFTTTVKTILQASLLGVGTTLSCVPPGATVCA